MMKAGDDEGAAGGRLGFLKQQDSDAKEGKTLSKLSSTPAKGDWTKASCPCCESKQVEPLVLVKLGGKVGPETKRWLIRLIGAQQKDGGEAEVSSSQKKKKKSKNQLIVKCFLFERKTFADEKNPECF